MYAPSNLYSIYCSIVTKINFYIRVSSNTNLKCGHFFNRPKFKSVYNLLMKHNHVIIRPKWHCMNIYKTGIILSNKRTDNLPRKEAVFLN